MDFSYKFNTIWLELLNTYTDQVTILSICQITSFSIEPNVFDKMIIYDWTNLSVFTLCIGMM